MIHLVRLSALWKLITQHRPDYEQQRRDLLRKHGIDLEDGNGDTTKTKRLDRREADRIMGDGPGGVFTWREKNRKKVGSHVAFRAFYSSLV